MNGAYADQIIRVMVELKAEIMKRAKNDEIVEVDDVDEITRLAFQRCADFYGVSEQTVANKCTTAMEMRRQDFYDFVKLYLLTDNTTFHLIGGTLYFFDNELKRCFLKCL